MIDGVNQKVDFNARDRGFSEISGRVFDDLNGNGSRDANESYLANQTINLGTNYEGFRDTTFATATTKWTRFFSIQQFASRTFSRFRRLAEQSDLVLRPATMAFTRSIFVRPNESTTLQFGLAPVNDPPVAVADISTTFEGVSVEIDVAANDTDERRD